MPFLAEKNRLTLGFSPCPNDTFIFNALVHGQACGESLDFGEASLADVETLNEWALAGRLDVTKLSFHAPRQWSDGAARLEKIFPVRPARGRSRDREHFRP